MEQFSLDAMVWYTSKKMVNGGGFNFEAKVALWLYLVMRRNTKKISASLKVSNMEITFKANSIVHCSRNT